MDMSISSHKVALPSPDPEAIVGVLGSLAVPLVRIVTVSNVVDWSAGQTALATVAVGALAGKSRDESDSSPREHNSAPANHADTRIRGSSGRLVVVDERPARAVETRSTNTKETAVMAAHGNNIEPQHRQGRPNLSHPDRVAMMRQREEIRHLPETDCAALAPDCERCTDSPSAKHESTRRTL
jgi:hypothetical protein